MTADLDALEALAKAAHAEWYAKDLSMTLRNYHTSTRPEVVLALIAELRQERERADRLEASRDQFRTAWNAYGFEILRLEDALSRAEETIEAIREATGHTMHPEQDKKRCGVCRIERLLTEYDKQKGADLG